jgi:hypothetical protein
LTAGPVCAADFARAALPEFATFPPIAPAVGSPPLLLVRGVMYVYGLWNLDGLAGIAAPRRLGG